MKAEDLKVLVVGSGGREHALVWKLSKSKRISHLYAAPGNPGMKGLAQLVPISTKDTYMLAEWAKHEEIDLTVVGPEQPLVDGMVDEFEARRLAIIGPTKRAAQLEGSKAFAKEFMRRNNIPTASFQIFTDTSEALDFVREANYPLVIKADGLAAGKGVVVVDSVAEAEEKINQFLYEGKLGEAGKRIVVEEFLNGEEVSVIALSDGRHVKTLIPAIDHKRLLDGDRGPNTGGMGACAPAFSLIRERQLPVIEEEILERTIWGMWREGIPYKGFLYAGLMLTERGPKVLEFNCRLGDPEAQAILPLLKTDLMHIFEALLDGELDVINPDWEEKHCACVVLASEGYPENPHTGREISGLNGLEGVLPFFAGVAEKGERYYTAGGRVVGLTAVDADFDKALNKAYAAAEKVNFEGKQYRHDIGYRLTAKTRVAR
ncbi:MAG: phosphoribosylamine--glycine ligase [candidate division Zixibacteria bacterium]|nr:phosphoribosylamine--glycine ligase [candidate division Zixibacteria bacterium]